MAEIPYRRHCFPPVIIQHAVWLYLRFTLSYRDVEELLAERGLDISYETIRCWVRKFGPLIARRLRRCRPRPASRVSFRWRGLQAREQGRRAEARELVAPVYGSFTEGFTPPDLKEAKRLLTSRRELST